MANLVKIPKAEFKMAELKSAFKNDTIRGHQYIQNQKHQTFQKHQTPKNPSPKIIRGFLKTKNDIHTIR